MDSEILRQKIYAHIYIYILDGELSWILYWTFGFYKKLGNYRVLRLCIRFIFFVTRTHANQDCACTREHDSPSCPGEISLSHPSDHREGSCCAVKTMEATQKHYYFYLFLSHHSSHFSHLLQILFLLFLTLRYFFLFQFTLIFLLSFFAFVSKDSFHSIIFVLLYFLFFVSITHWTFFLFLLQNHRNLI
jgi:hypothetical protein